MVDLKNLKASDGTGSAVLAHVTFARLPAATTLKVDSIDNWPPYFIATSGTLNAGGYIMESGKTEFRGHVSGVDIVIDGFEPGFTDIGNTTANVVVVKQTTGWADGVADTLRNVLNDDSTLKNSAVATVLAAIGGNSSGWFPITGSPITAISYLGNGSFSATTNIDFATFASPGYRVGMSRTVAAPTQCTSLNGTNQYFSKTTPAGMTYTDDFTTGVWVKATSYANATIASRYNGTSGWTLVMLSTGQIQLAGFNAGAGNVSYVQSYQSIPLNKWVYVTAQLDMSAFTATPTTSYIMINGIDAPAFVARAGTNPTALIQAGNLEIGGQNGGLLPWPGKIVQAAMFNAKVLQATVLGYISQSLIGTETALISAYSFNNVLTDLNTSNANNLTAQNGALATNADSPFGVQGNNTIDPNKEYTILQKIVSATNVILQSPEGGVLPTTGGVGTVRYSPIKNPLAFPTRPDRWQLVTVGRVNGNQASPVAATWYNAGFYQLLLPIGSWKLDTEHTGYASTTVATNTGLSTTVSTGAATESDSNFSCYYEGQNTSVFALVGKRSQPVYLDAATRYYQNMKYSGGGTFNTFGIYAALAPMMLRAENGFL